MHPAIELSLFASGAFLMTGLLTGIWKWVCIHRSDTATAPAYVDIAHRASLMYAFAAMVITNFVQFSPYSVTITFWATAAPLFFFAIAIIFYIVHGILRDTDNQFLRPHKLGTMTLPSGLIVLLMLALIIGEVGGFGLLFWGFVQTVMLA
ncbi:MAG: hypothetical protein JSU95_01090 [Betaproteobacteria bacterium]|nr:MAG: hypothetical protein JSU95_01090 [Betaproteobacteria bacterium]